MRDDRQIAEIERKGNEQNDRDRQIEKEREREKE